MDAKQLGVHPSRNSYLETVLKDEFDALGLVVEKRGDCVMKMKHGLKLNTHVELGIFVYSL